ncbi:MAG: FAD-binding oxidoreductase [Anaerolineales bacterium]|nr:FAD-binding oxidoreductase [Anaerolineales bacterium]
MDYVIIGGGVYGAATAWALAQQGREVLLLEAQTVAAGASGGLGKRGVRANGRDLREMPLMARAYDIWPTLHEQLGGPTGYERQGHLLLFERERDLHGAPAQAQVQAANGIPSHWLTPAELYDLEPDLRRTMLGALFCPLDGIADHTATTRSFAAAASQAGATIREGCQVTRLERSGSRIEAVITAEEERIPVDGELLLLNNTGAVAMLAREFDLKLPIYPILPQVMLTERVEPMPVRHLIGHAHRRLAIKNNPDGRVMISGGWLGQVDETTGRFHTVPTEIMGNLAEAQAVYPALEGIGVSEASADRPEGVSFDGIPIIDQLPGLDNLTFAAGWSGHGWAIAPAVAQLLAEWRLTGRRPDLLTPFNLTRFGLG